MKKKRFPLWLLLLIGFFLFSNISIGSCSMWDLGYTAIAVAGIGIAIFVLAVFLIVAIALSIYRNSNKKEKQKESPSTVKAEETTAQPQKSTITKSEEDVLSKVRKQLVEERIIIAKTKNEDVKAATLRVLSLVDKILNALHDNPSKIQSSSQFLNYYVPTLGVILQKYRRLELSGVDITGTPEKIISYMSDIERALTKEYEGLFKDDLIDLSVEMKAMTIACKRDGLLTDEDLEKAYREQHITLEI